MTRKFFGLFEGIGGFRLAAESLGWESVGYCEIDKFALQTYRANFDTTRDAYFEDATTIDMSVVPDFDVLFAGFPCQPFSMAGNRKGEDDSRGTLFYEIIRMLQAKKPEMFLLENVKGLKAKTFARTFTVMTRQLQDSGYRLTWKILNTADYGIPQHRERLFIVGWRDDSSDFHDEFLWPKPIPLRLKLKDILEENVPEKYYLSKTLIEALMKHKQRHRMKKNGFGFHVLNQEGVSNSLLVGGAGRENNLVANTITNRYFKDGSENLIAESGLIQSRGLELKDDGETHTSKSRMNVLVLNSMQRSGNPKLGGVGPLFKVDAAFAVDSRPHILVLPHGNNEGSFKPSNISPTIDKAGSRFDIANQYRLRRFTPRECARLQGFPDSFRIPVSDTQAYKQFGNAVSVNVVKAILRSVEEANR